VLLFESQSSLGLFTVIRVKVNLVTQRFHVWTEGNKRSVNIAMTQVRHLTPPMLHNSKPILKVSFHIPVMYTPISIG